MDLPSKSVEWLQHGAGFYYYYLVFSAEHLVYLQ